MRARASAKSRFGPPSASSASSSMLADALAEAAQQGDQARASRLRWKGLRHPGASDLDLSSTDNDTDTEPAAAERARGAPRRRGRAG